MSRISNRRARIIAPVLAASALTAPAAAAHAGDVQLTARDGARVQVAVPSKLRGQALQLTVDGRRKTIVDHPATFSVQGLANRRAAWHQLRLHGRRSTASARFAVGVRHGRHSPTLVLTQAPSRRTVKPTAKFRYSTSGRRIACTLDGKTWPCSLRSAHVTTGAGRHVFGLRVRSGKSVSTLSWTWSVAGTTAAPAPSGTPNNAPSESSPTPGPSANAEPPAGGGGASGAPAGWRLLMSDSFDGSSLNASNWQSYGPNWPGNGGNGVRDQSALSVGGGVLTITAQMVGRTLVSGAVASRVSTTYGRVEFRVRADADPSGATSAVVLMWPTSGNWPIDGETDIFETGTEADRDWFSSFVHYGADNRQVWFGHDADATQWHAMAMEWTPTSIRFYRDGMLEGEVTDPAVISDAAQHLCVQLDAFSSTMTGTVRMQVDDVRMYALAG